MPLAEMPFGKNVETLSKPVKNAFLEHNALISVFQIIYL